MVATLFGTFALINVALLVAVLRWKKWGWFGLVVTAVVAFPINLLVYDTSYIIAASGLLLPVLLFVVLKRGYPPTWDQLDDFEPSDLLSPQLLGAGLLAILLPFGIFLGVVPAIVGGCEAGASDTMIIARGPVYPEGDEIFVTDLDGSSECALTDAHTVNTSALAWSPNRDKLLISSEGHSIHTTLRELHIMNPDGSGIARITNGVSRGASLYGGTWSPDGTKILYPSRDDSVVSLYVVDSDGSNRTQIVSGNASQNYYGWSPDGTMIAFTGSVEESDDRAVLVANADGSEIRRLTDDPSARLFSAWLSTGEFLVAGPPGPDESDEVFLVSRDGSAVTQLTTSARTRFSGVSPDETAVLVSEQVGDDLELFLIDLTTGSRTQLTDNDVDIYGGRFSPDGSRIVYSYPTAPNESVVYVVDADGSNTTQVTRDGEDSATGPWG